MSPWTPLDKQESTAQVDGRPAPVPTPASASPAGPSTPHELTYAERQGLAMGWVAIALGTLLLLGGLALWAAWAFSAGFGAWLLAVGVMGLLMVALVVAVNYVVLQPTR
jgi:hypothetical protein